MGNRSYLLTEKDGQFTVQLEANNLLPLLWVALASSSTLSQPSALPSASPGIDNHPARGLTIPLREGLENLARRRALTERWMGGAGALVLDQFSQLLRDSLAHTISVDLTEFLDAYGSAEEALAILRKAVEALDIDAGKSPGATRRPPKIKWLMDEFSLSGVDADTPLFGVALAGAADDESEPWHRDPPRKRRVAGEALRLCSSNQLVSANGKVVMANAANREGLTTPQLWNREAGSVTAIPVPDHVEDIYPHHMSADGRTIVGSCHTYPGKRSSHFRYSDGRVDILPFDPKLSCLIKAISVDASAMIGHFSAKADWRVEWESRRACRFEANGTVRPIGPDGMVSDATMVTPDGRVVAGFTEQGPLTVRQQRAFIWSEAGGLEDLGASYFALEWKALAPDGRSGVLKSMSTRGGPWTYHFWRHGQPLSPIPALDGAELVRVSPSADAIVARIPDRARPIVWTLANGARELAIEDTEGALDPEYVADGGATIVLSESFADARYARYVLLWSEGGELRRHPVSSDAQEHKIFFRSVNHSANTGDVVLVGDDIGTSQPLIWTADRGVQVFPFESAAD